MLKSEMLLFAMNDLDDSDLESARKRLGYQTGGATGRNVKKRIITFALAAALILALGATAYAIVSNYIKSRTVDDEAITGTWYGQYVAYPEAEYELSFEIHADQCYKAVFQANWLPETDSPATGWHEYLAKGGESEGVLYTVQIYNGALLKNTKFYFNGHMTVMKKDDWRGFKRIELYGDYRDSVPKHVTTMLDRNYLLLFSEQDGYLVYIASSVYDLDVLEKIADNLQFQITDEVVPFENAGEIIALLDLGSPETDGTAASQNDIDSTEQASHYANTYDFLMALLSNELIDGEAEFVQKGAFFFHDGYYKWLMSQPEDEPIVIIVHGVFPDMTDEDTAHDIKTAKVFEDLGLTVEVWGGQGTENGLDYAGSCCYVTITPREMLELSDHLYDGENYFFLEEQYSSVKARMTEKLYPEN